MKIPRRVRLFCIFMMSTLMTHIPAVALSEGAALAHTGGTVSAHAGGMTSTAEVISQLSRAEAEQKVLSYLDRAEIQKALEKQGLSKDEVSSRLATLSANEMNQLATQMDQAKYGGDILFAILIVVLIIFLVKRI